MAAQVLARALDLELYRVDLAEVVNKYIGETEKRLAQVFDECERGNVMVFFDEADALFGQRTRSRDAHDRFANIEIDYLLQRMEHVRRRRGPRHQPQGRPRPGVPAPAARRSSTSCRRRAAERRRLWELALPSRRDRLAVNGTSTARGWPSSSSSPAPRSSRSALAAAFRARDAGELIGTEHVLARPARAGQARRVLRIEQPIVRHDAPIAIDRLTLDVGRDVRGGCAAARPARRAGAARPGSRAARSSTGRVTRSPSPAAPARARRAARRRASPPTAALRVDGAGCMSFYLRGALVEFMPTVLIPIPNMIVFQFNPETMTHTWTQPEAPRPPGQGRRHREPARGQGRCRARRSASRSRWTRPTSIADGAVAAALAQVSGVYTPARRARDAAVPGERDDRRAARHGDRRDRLGVGGAAGGGVQRTVPADTMHTVLFVWGPGRIVPGAGHALTVTERLYDSILNPTHAEAQIGLRVLTAERARPHERHARRARQGRLHVLAGPAPGARGRQPRQRRRVDRRHDLPI